MTKHLLLGAAAACGAFQAIACTGISLTAADGSYVQGRTIEWAQGPLSSRYVVLPRGHALRSLTPSGADGLALRARYGAVGLSVVAEEFIAEGINEAGLSAGLFFFPRYGGYRPYDPAQKERTVSDLQLVSWILTQCASIDEVKERLASIRVAGLEPASVVHWRIGEPSGRQVVLEIVGGEARFFENPVGVLTNAPGFEWQLTNLDNYVNLRPGNAEPLTLGTHTLLPTGSSSGMLGLPGDATPPSRFVRAAFYRATAPQQADTFGAVVQCFHLLNLFDIPIGIEHPAGEAPDIPSATQWTSAIDLTHRRVYYRTAYDSTIRCIDLARIDFASTPYRSGPLDREQRQPVVQVALDR
ncbi:choloylglycine hydrolase family protein [uncultured Alistipes sp.]|uniref:choloylglycine hydrolase family protein n=1 Tax=uncultured Alistipes sp. TaxID=538949 RepID=UPI00262B45D9|nr:choloylglycine hydrolase family protein [uncultured Alistipes sp.]